MSKVAVVCHDAGGAEIVSHWLQKQSLSSQYCVEGPAIKVFQRVLGDKVVSNSLDNIISESDWVLCGSSWQSDLEKIAIKKAKTAGKKVITYLDHWVNYKDRFLLDNEKVFPDEIWVADQYALKIAKESLPGLIIKLVGNPYLDTICTQIKHLSISSEIQPKHKILFLGENISEHAKKKFGNEQYWGYTENDALIYLLENLAHFQPNEDLTIKIRPHPSENSEKYQWAVDTYSPRLFISNNSTLEKDITECQIIAGCESMAMIIGLMAGKTVISCIPPRGKYCSLPHEGILHLRKLFPESN